jgi:hypothetical protein
MRAHRRPAEEPDHQDGDKQARTGHCHEGDCHEQERYGQHDIDEPGQDRVGPAPEETRDQADNNPGDHREHGGHDPDQQGDPRAVGNTDRNVTAEVIGAERELRTWRLRQPFRAQAGIAVLLVDRMADKRGHQRGEYGDQDDQYDHGQ